MQFDLPKDQSSIIKVIGVGGGGSNAVNYMYEQGIKGVDFMVCNTDSQALDTSPVPLKIQLGATLTEGRGAGSLPEVGRNAAIENLDDVKEILANNTTMVFVTAGMGGGTGTGAAPIIAQTAREMGILTVGIVTVPFIFEGRKRKTQAEEGLQEMRDAVDTLLVIRNDKLRELYGNLTVKAAFSHADEVLCTAAKGIAEVITLTGDVNVDMNDVNTVMKNSGAAIMGSGKAHGEGRAMKAVSEALESPLLNDNDITGAEFVLLNITYGDEEVLMDEISEITDYIQDHAGLTAEVIWGYGQDESLGEDLCVTVIATGFSAKEIDSGLPYKAPEVKKFDLGTDEPKQIIEPVATPISPIPFVIEDNESVDVSTEPEAEPFLMSRNETSDEEVETPVEPASTELEFKLELRETEAAEPETTQEQPLDQLLHEATKPNEPIVYHDLNDDGVNDGREEGPTMEADELKFKLADTTTAAPEAIDIQQINREREQRIREFTSKLKSPTGLADLESVPAYKRKDVQLDDVPHSSESQLSRYTLTDEGEEEGKPKAGLRPNNPFLHDNVD